MTDPIAQAIDALRTERGQLLHRIGEIDRGLEVLESIAKPAPAKNDGRRKTKKKTAKKKRKAKATASGISRTTSGDHPEVARWRRQLLKPILEHEAGSPERTAALKELCSTEVTRPDGTRWTPTRTTVYLWIQQAEAK